MIEQAVNNIETIKINTWESVIASSSKKLRKKEAKIIKNSAFLSSLLQSVWFALPTALSVSLFTLYISISEAEGGLSELTIEEGEVYQLITIFSLMMIPAKQFITTLARRAEAVDSDRRLLSIINLEDREEQEDDRDLEVGEVQVIHSSYSWEDPEMLKYFKKQEMDQEEPNPENQFLLRKVYINLKKGDFVAIAGPSGAGKSNLLLAIMQEMVIREGHQRKRGSIAYVPQTPFLTTGTILDNILFGRGYKKERLERCLEVCQLVDDLELLDLKEETLVGVGGVELALETRQKINLARALYSNSDIYLIDNIFSEVGAAATRMMISDVLMTELVRKTRIVVAPDSENFDLFEKMIFLNNGEIKGYGDVDKVLNELEGSGFTLFAEGRRKTKKSNFSGYNFKRRFGTHRESRLSRRPSSELTVSRWDDRSELLQLERTILIDRTTTRSGGARDRNTIDLALRELREQSLEPELTTIESLVEYFRQAGWVPSILTFLLFLGSFGLKVSADWWAGRQIELISMGRSSKTYKDLLFLYILLGAICVSFSIVRAYGASVIAKSASMTIFSKFINTLIKKPAKFFTQKNGQNLNKTLIASSQDLHSLDYGVSTNLILLITNFLSFFGCFFLASLCSPFVISVVILATVYCYGSLKRYLKVCLEFRRGNQESTLRMFSFVSEVFEGLPLFRVYQDSEEIFRNAYLRIEEQMSSFSYRDEACILWIKVRVEICVWLVLVTACVLAVINQSFQ